MSYLLYQRPCLKDPQPLEFNSLDVRHTVPFRKLKDPMEYKYNCYTECPYKPPRTKGELIEGFDFNNDLWDYKPTSCMYTTTVKYLCLN
jgi:hypothetical protein